MRIKLDENLPSQLASRLNLLGHDVQTVGQEGLSGKPDPRIWDVAQREARFVITQDMDFSDSRRFAPGSHHGMLLVRLREPSRRALIERVDSIFQKEDVGQWLRCFVVATDHKIRVRRPAKGKKLFQNLV